MFGFVKLIFISAMMFFGCSFSINNQECKVRPQNINLNGDEPVFFFLVLKQVNAVVFATKSITYMQNCVFLMLSKI